MSIHLLVAFHGKVGPLPFAPSVPVPLSNDQAEKAKDFIQSMDAFDTSPGNGSFDVHESGSLRVPFIGGLPFDGVVSLSIVGVADPAQLPVIHAAISAIPAPD